MSILPDYDLNKLLVTYLDLTNDYPKMKLVNQFYYRIISQLPMYRAYVDLHLFTKYSFTTKNLFVNACKSNNMTYQYLLSRNKTYIKTGFKHG